MALFAEVRLLGAEVVFIHVESDHGFEPDCSIAFGNWSNTTRPLVALSSFPGSGNTWTRHLLELASGVYTGAYSYDNDLYLGGFTGETEYYKRGRTLVIKDHRFRDEYKSAILLIRNPYDAVITLYHYHKKKHTGKIPLREFKNNVEWEDFAMEHFKKWINMMAEWISSKKPLLVVHYEDLKHDTVYEVKRMLSFLNMTLTPERLHCLEMDIEGNFHRHKEETFDFDPYTADMHTVIKENIRLANGLLRNINIPSVREPSYDKNIHETDNIRDDI
uniref:WSC domain-containing protein 2-like n=1 Tax=Saccoglossus kowalevskii TaxID=10224 RepID=A0ABM0MTA1_SACKO|nr:PREDICTED: WSC domain-containing protein 2-like [Saccoglossus kowalevskii]